MAAAYPNATVLSLAGQPAASADVQRHLAALRRRGLRNNAVALRSPDAGFARDLFESPEFLRFLVRPRSTSLVYMRE